MTFLFLALAILAGGGLLSLLLARWERVCLIAAAGTILAGCAAGLGAAWTGLTGEAESFREPWSVPGGSFSFTLDPLAGFFLLVIFVASALIGVYATGYLQD